MTAAKKPAVKAGTTAKKPAVKAGTTRASAASKDPKASNPTNEEAKAAIKEQSAVDEKAITESENPTTPGKQAIPGSSISGETTSPSETTAVEQEKGISYDDLDAGELAEIAKSRGLSMEGNETQLRKRLRGHDAGALDPEDPHEPLTNEQDDIAKAQGGDNTKNKPKSTEKTKKFAGNDHLEVDHEDDDYTYVVVPESTDYFTLAAKLGYNGQELATINGVFNQIYSIPAGATVRFPKFTPPDEREIPHTMTKEEVEEENLRLNKERGFVP